MTLKKQKQNKSKQTGVTASAPEGLGCLVSLIAPDMLHVSLIR